MRTYEKSIYAGDTAGVWLVGHEQADGTYSDLDGNYTCSLEVTGQAIKRAVTDKNGDNDRYLAYLTPAETAGLAKGEYVLGIELINATLIPPLNRQVVIRLFVEDEIVT